MAEKDLLRVGSFIDVRAPCEFRKGHLPNSVNIPILDDLERDLVGKAYKKHGKERAVNLGHELCSGARKSKLLQDWVAEINKKSSINLLCLRGGLRSQIASKWLQEIGETIHPVEGGYKALRQTCLSLLEKPDKKFWIIGGKTGSGKTEIIKNLSNSIDLEGRASHRGSAFGRQLKEQPSLSTFENHLAVDYLGLDRNSLVLEDEGRSIGSVSIPSSWFELMRTSPIALVKLDLEDRVARIKAEYVDNALKEYSDDSVAVQKLHERYQESARKIAKRLGANNLASLQGLIEEAFLEKREHNDWIEHLLSNYYDPMYEYQLRRKRERIVFSGDGVAVREFLNSIP